MNRLSTKSCQESGRQLANLMLSHQNNTHSIVLCLSEGAIPVALAIAGALNINLDIQLVKSFSIPGEKTLLKGAITSDGETHLSCCECSEPEKDPFFKNSLELKLKCLERLEIRYRNGRKRQPLLNKNVILVGDGSESVSALLAAIKSTERHKPRSITLASSGMNLDTMDAIRLALDRVVCLEYSNHSYECLFPRPTHARSIQETKQLIWEFWKNSSFMQHNRQTTGGIRSIYTYHNNVATADWHIFAKSISDQHAGSYVSIRHITFYNGSSRGKIKPFHSRRVSLNSPFIGISYLADRNLFCVRYLHDGKMNVQNISHARTLVFRDSSVYKQSLKIDTDQNESFYILLDRELKSDRPLISANPAAGRKH